MVSTLSPGEEAQLTQTIEMFEVITQSQPHDYQSLEILKEAYSKLGREKDVIGTSKRIAEAYVQMGQLSSAILEYETVLQRFPDDPDVQKALKQIESKASNFSDPPPLETPSAKPASDTSKLSKADKKGPVDDGRAMMVKVFVDTRIITSGDFDLCWSSVDTTGPGVVEPFVAILANKGILPIDKALKVLSDKARMAFLPLEKYDVDIELSRNFPAAVCRRWCVLPFDRMSKSILVATANPFSADAAKELAQATPSRLLWYLSPPDEIIKNLRKAFR